MIIKYSPVFLATLKKLDVRIRKDFKERLNIFKKNPNDPLLDNHPLKREYEGYRSIDITFDYRAVYREVDLGEEELTAYFILIGIHNQLYGKQTVDTG